MRAIAVTALLAFVIFVLPQVTGSGDAEYVHADPTGDVSLLIENPAGIPQTTATSAVDLTALRIEAEDGAGFDLVLQVAELKVETSSSLCCFASIDFRGQFELAGAEPVYYFTAYIYGAYTADAASTFVADPRQAWGYFFVCQQRCLNEEVPIDLDDSANTITLHFSKSILLGLHEGRDRIGGLPSNLRAGDALSGLSVRAGTSGLVFALRLVDAIPNGGDELPPYIMKTGTANTVIAVDLPNAADGLALVPGLNQSIPFVLTNHAESKRLLQLEYVLTGPAEKTALYSVFAPPTLTLPAGETRNFTLALDVKASAKATDGVRLAIHAKSPLRPDEIGFARVNLIPGATLGPGSNVLHIHSRPAQFMGLPTDEVVCTHQFFFGCGDYPFLSPLEQDPEGGDEPIPSDDGLNPTGTSERWFAFALRPFPQPLAFAPKEPVTLELALQAPVRAEGLRIQAELFYGNEHDSGTLLSAQTTATVDTTPTVIELAAPPDLGGKDYIGPGNYIGLQIRVTSTLSPSGSAAGAAGGLTLLPKQSRITLPLVDLPEGLANTAKASPFQLGVLGDREEFVNPGEARLMNITVLNQDAASHRAQLYPAVDQPGWAVEMFPGATYDLNSGDTVKVAVLVHAPAGAKEGETAKIRIEAMDEKGVNVTLPLVVTATSGFDFRDDALGFETDEEARAKLAVAKGQDTPGFESVLVALALVLLGVARRRKA